MIKEMKHTKKEEKKAMEEMECWHFKEHLKKCDFCQKLISKLFVEILKDKKLD